METSSDLGCISRSFFVHSSSSCVLLLLHLGFIFFFFCFKISGLECDQIDAICLIDDLLVDGVGGGGAVVDADGAAEDEDSDEAEGDLDVVLVFLDLLAASVFWI